MISFREWLREAAECKKDVKESTEYKEYFKKILAKYDVQDPSELSKEDKQKFFDEVDAGWKGEKEEPEAGDKDVNEAFDSTIFLEELLKETNKLYEKFDSYKKVIDNKIKIVSQSKLTEVKVILMDALEK